MYTQVDDLCEEVDTSILEAVVALEAVELEERPGDNDSETQGCHLALDPAGRPQPVGLQLFTHLYQDQESALGTFARTKLLGFGMDHVESIDGAWDDGVAMRKSDRTSVEILVVIRHQTLVLVVTLQAWVLPAHQDQRADPKVAQAVVVEFVEHVRQLMGT
ncbi:hypothetical protein EDC02_4693 [Micromonospora sp. Llam0]|uniref:hypothetical protein n=1 Tax=Micromonospora sp. Llam0 TaxID=2485143 RepID=UPI000F46EED5|nr:hypothetical protein [Micromonospora sp. Llam0]ROO62706.1 hypothetical protein EDC02_4693 [Micromonospora sp. Llam0]